VDANAVYIGVNVFNSAGTALLGTTGFVLRKSALLAGTLTVTAFRQLADATGAGMYTPQGVNNDDPNATEGYFIGVDLTSTNTLGIRRISNPGGAPSVSATLNVTVPSGITSPIAQPHKGDILNKKLDALDVRLFGAQINKNQLTGVSSLWTAHNVAVTSSGDPWTQGSGARNGSRWYEIRNLTSSPSVFQSGLLFDSASTNPRGFWIPSVAMNGQGHMALGCSYAGVNDFAGVAVAGRLASDPLNTIQTPTLAVISSTAYNIGESGSPHRWGDFSQVSVDPNDDMTMWTFQEYCNANNSWGVQAIQLSAPPPVTPSTATPASLNTGQTSVNVIITGTNNSGSGFFDPGPDTGGPGFSNHISATVNGGGVTVNSVTFSNATNITLNVTVAANATVGARTVTVTNPDGQAQTSVSGILTIVGNPVAPSISVQPASRTNLAGTTATFSVTASGSPTPAYQWVKNTSTVLTNGGNISGVTTSNLTIVNVGAADAAAYTVVITNSAGSVTSSVATLTVLTPPVASFSAQPTNGLVPLLVTFTNSSTGATNYSWTFGDGHTSTVTQPVNTYSNAGTFTVSLTATGPGGTSTLTRTNYILVTNPPPVVAFSASPTNGAAPLTVTFTNQTTGATNFSWTFGDGHTSTNAQPVNTYTNAGTYTVSLVANGPGGTSSLTHTNFILVTNPPPTVAFTANPTKGVVPLTVNFTNLTIGATNYTWDFGDGHTSTNSQPVNTYSNAGTYTVSLVANGPGGSSSLTHTNFILVTNPPPTVVFTANPTNGVAPLTVNFTNLTTGATNYAWDFGDGHSSTNTQPANTYSNAGTFTVSLTATGPGGASTLTRTNYILVTNPPPVVAFSASPTNGAAPLTVTFTNQTTGATNFSWTFGDGHISANAQPVNIYTNVGSYTVSLLAMGPGGSVSLTKTNFILVTNPPPLVAFVATPTNGPAPLTVTFSNLTTGATTNFAWDFGDGHTSTSAQPVNIYTNAGTYTVSLVANGPGGSSSLTQTNFILVTNPPPTVAFTANPTNGVAPLTVNFTNLTTGATNYAWDFGDGHTSANAQPVNIYTNAGTYTVSLVANGPGGTSSLTQTNFILVTNPPPVVAFSANPTNGAVPLTVTFTNLTTGATNFAWTFGDGHTSTNAEPVNTYTNAGLYTVSLVATGPGGSSTLTLTNFILVTNPPPVVDFLASPTNGPAPLTVTFTNLTTGATNYAWDFGDGHTSTNVQPANTYTNAGLYTVSLLATGPGGSSTLTLTNFILVTNPPPVVDFLASPTNGPAPLAVTFTNLTTGATNYAWDFGDGQTSTNVQPLNTYSNAGTYTVTLIAEGPGGSSTLIRTNFVLVTNPPPVAVFTANPTNGFAPLKVAFTNLTTGATAYAWDFGDGQTSTNVQPANIYTNAGTYTVSLLATGPGGSSLLIQTNYIEVLTAPPIILTISTSGGTVNLSWNSIPTRTYRAQFREDLDAPGWTDLVPDITATGSTAAATDTIGEVTHKFYRVMLLPGP
jgi:PKD repeat protein